MMAAALFVTLCGMVASWLFLLILIEIPRWCLAVRPARAARSPAAAKRRDEAPSDGAPDDELQLAVAIAVAMAQCGG